MADDNQDQSFAPIAAKWLGSGTDDGNIQRTARALRVAIDIPGTVPHPNIAYWCETLTGHQKTWRPPCTSVATLRKRKTLNGTMKNPKKTQGQCFHQTFETLQDYKLQH